MVFVKNYGEARVEVDFDENVPVSEFQVEVDGLGGRWFFEYKPEISDRQPWDKRLRLIGNYEGCHVPPQISAYEAVVKKSHAENLAIRGLVEVLHDARQFHGIIIERTSPDPSSGATNVTMR